MNKMAWMAICFFALVPVSAFGQGSEPIPQSVIVGAVNPNAALGGFVAYAQEFSLGFPAYVNGVDLGLYVFPGRGGPPAVGSTCTFSVAITDSIFPDGSIGSVLVGKNESVVVPATDQGIIFSDSLPGTLLSAGSYYLVLANAGASPCFGFDTGLDWMANAQNSVEVGTVGEPFISYDFKSWTPYPTFIDEITHQILVVKFSFDLVGPVIPPPPTGGSFGQIVRFIVQGPVTPPPGGPVEVQLGFMDMNGNAIGPTSTVTLNPGQIQSLDLNLSQFVSRLGQRIEVRPSITEVPNAAGAPSSSVQFSSSVQVLDALTGIGTVLNPVPNLGDSVPALSPQALAGGQTMRVNVVAETPDPCFGQVSFTDKNGSPIGSTLPVNLNPGMGTSLDLDAETLPLRFGQSIEVQPTMTVGPAVGAAPVNSVCQISVEVFDHLTGRTESYQSSFVALPAVQSQQ
jgi:hypothetical protein